MYAKGWEIPSIYFSAPARDNNAVKQYSIASSTFHEDYSLWSKLLKGLQQESLVRNAVLKPCQCSNCPTSKTIETWASHWEPWLWVLNNLAAVFSFTFILSTVIENGLMMCSAVLCSIFYSLHYVCPVGTDSDRVRVSNGSVGIGPGTSTIKLDELLAPRKRQDRVLAGAKCFMEQDTWMLQRSAPVTWKSRVFSPARFPENRSISDEIRENLLHVSAGKSRDWNWCSLFQV